MADFNKEFEKVVLAEGGYCDDPDDTGGETYVGISRKYNPNWSGWPIIDAEKKKGLKNITARLKKNKELNDKLKLIYKQKYWDVLDLDDIPSQKIAHQLFDTCVNCGKATAIRIAQQVIGMTVTGKWSDELRYNLMQYGKKN